jgi:hypothetical protein
MQSINALLTSSRKKYQRLQRLSLVLSSIMLMLITLSIGLAVLAVFTGQSGVAELFGWPKAMTIQEINYNWKVICGVVALLDVLAFAIHRLERGFDLRGRVVVLEKQQLLLEHLQEFAKKHAFDQGQLDQALAIIKPITEK